MSVKIRRACQKDTQRILLLLSEVLEIHAKLRPDIFISGTTKYTKDELLGIFQNDDTPVFVAVDETDEAVGSLFCVIQEQPFSTTMRAFKTLYIDDLCVAATCRAEGVGSALYRFALEYAKERGCYDVTLNVWEGNDARSFYEKMGMRVKETQMQAIVGE